MTVDVARQVHQYLTTAPSSLFAQQSVEMLDHWQGDDNLLWRVRSGSEHAVVKLFLDAGQARSRRQFDGHRIFAPFGLAPEPLWADRYPHGLARQLIVYRWSNGEPLDVRDPGDLASWAAAIAALHSTPTEEVQRFSPHPVNLDFYWRIERGSFAQVQQWLADSGLDLAAWFATLASATANLVKAKLPLWQEAAPTAVHGDLALAHTLLERGRICLLDWEMFGLGDPALDVARLLQREEQSLPPAVVEQWLQHYLAAAHDQLVGERIQTYRQLLEVHNVVYLLTGLRQNVTNGIEPALRDALPYVLQAITAALTRTTDTLALPPLPTEANELVSAFGKWLTANAMPNNGHH